jgi:hypothetical protein
MNSSISAEWQCFNCIRKSVGLEGACDEATVVERPGEKSDSVSLVLQKKPDI